MTESRLRGVQTAPAAGLTSLLKSWVKIMEYEDSFAIGIQVPWLRNERALTGFLAGAVWRCGGVVLEEFCSTKGSLNSRGRGLGVFKGRTDIAFILGGDMYQAEVKVCRPSLSRTPGSALRQVRQALKKAIMDARIMADDSRHQYIAIVFATPYISHSSKHGYTRSVDQVRSFIADLQKIKRTAIAWTFPHPRGRLSKQRMMKLPLHPGIALLAKPIPPSHISPSWSRRDRRALRGGVWVKREVPRRRGRISLQTRQKDSQTGCDDFVSRKTFNGIVDAYSQRNEILPNKPLQRPGCARR